ncbi:MAG: DUF2490 domain-containing protein [Cyclobacteriaceae bacterium]
MMRYLVVLIGVLFINCSPLFAQRTVNTQSLYWVKYGASFAVGTDLKIQASIEDRRYFKNNRQHMWLYTLDANKRLKNGWSAGVGFMRWTILMPSDPESLHEVTQGEWRPFQYLTHSAPLSGRFEFGQRMMLEERIRQNFSSDPLTGSPVIEDGYYAYLRYRHRLQITAKINAVDSRVPISVTLANEAMLHFGDDRIINTFDQNRVSIAMNLKLLESTKLSLGYLNWYQQSAATTDYVRRNIATLYVTQQF